VPNKRTLLWLGAWLVLLACAFLVDQAAEHWLMNHHFHSTKAAVFRDTPWADAIKSFGSYYMVVALAAALVLAGLLTRRQACILLLCGATAITTEALKWVAGRPRPYKYGAIVSDPMEFVPFSTHQLGNSFPSGHAMVAFATAACLARYYPRWSPLFYAVAILVAIERVLEVAHYVSDVVAGAGIGIILSQTCMWVLSRWLPGPQPAILKAVESTNT
jgi:membrane-associated phospholipid phosphatase